MTDGEALAAYVGRRDAEAFARLVEEYQRLVYAACRRKLRRREDLEDAVQETFLRLAQHAGTLRSNVGGWLYRCALNVAQDMNRRRAVGERVMAEAGAAGVGGPRGAGNEDPQRHLMELREQLDAAMEKLEEEDRELIVQRYFAGRAQVELAAERGLSAPAISQRISRAVEALRRHLQALGCGAAVVGSAAALEGLLGEETASAAVPAELTANLMKIGLMGVSGAGTGTAVAGGVGVVMAWIAAGLLLVGGAVAFAWLWKGPVPAPVALASAVVGGRATTQLSGVTAGAGDGRRQGGALPPEWQKPAELPRGVLAGRILDKEGRPVPGARVTLYGERKATAPVMSDAQGIYVFESVAAAGQFRIGVEAEGYIAVQPFVSRDPGIQLAEGTQARRDVVIDKGVEVRVVLKSAEPIDTREVTAGALLVGSETAPHYEVRRASAEVLWFTLPSSGESYSITVQCRGFAPGHAVVKPVSADQPIEVLMPIERGDKVKGVAICSDGKPAAGWSISARPDWWNSNTMPYEWPIGEDGTFTLEGIGKGTYHLDLSIPTGQGMSSSQRVATVTMPPEQQPVRLQLPMPSPSSLATLKGSVRFKGGVPDYVMVDVTDGQRMYSTNVRPLQLDPVRRRGGGEDVPFELQGIVPGTYRVRFDSPTIEAKTLERFKIPSEEPLVVELEVPGKPHVVGRLVDAQTKAAIGNYAIRIAKTGNLGESYYVQDSRWIQVSNAEGAFDAEVVGPGIYKVQISLDGYAWSWSPEIRVEKLGDRAEVVLQATRGGSLFGKVVDAAGKAVAGAKVIPLSMGRSAVYQGMDRFDSEAGAVMTDGEGKFELKHLSAGKETLKVVGAAYAPTMVRDVEVVEGESRDAGTVTIGVGGTVEGTVYDASGKPAVGVVVQFRDSESYGGGDEEAGRVAAPVTDAAGHFVVQHLPGQVLYVGVGRAGELQGVFRRVVMPVEGKTARLDFGGTSEFRGRILNGGKGVANKRVMLAAGPAYQAPVMVSGDTDGEGRFVLRGVPAGHYHLFADAGVQETKLTKVRDVEVKAEGGDVGDVEVELGDVEIRIEADSQSDMDFLKYVSVATDDPRKDWQNIIGSASMVERGRWRSLELPAGHFQAMASLEADGMYLSYNVPFERKGRETVVNVRLPARSATMKPVFHGSTRAAVMRSEDRRLEITLSSERAGRLQFPPGTYRVMDSRVKWAESSNTIVRLVAGENGVVEIPELAAVKEKLSGVMVRVWSKEGVWLPAVVRMVDGTGKEVEADPYEGLGKIFRAVPGSYRVKVGRYEQEVVVPAVDPASPGSITMTDVHVP